MVADQELVTVFVPDDPTELALAEGILRERGIPYAAKNSEVQNLFGAGEIGAYSPAIDSVEIQVSAGDLERSRALIAEALEAAQPTGVSPLAEKVFRYSRYSLFLAVLFGGGIGSLLGIYFGWKALALARQEPDLSTWRAKFGLALGVIGLVGVILYWGLSRS